MYADEHIFDVVVDEQRAMVCYRTKSNQQFGISFEQIEYQLDRLDQ